MLLDAPGRLLLLAVESPKSVALPRVAMVTKSIVLSPEPLVLLGPNTALTSFELAAIYPASVVESPKKAALPVVEKLT